MHMPSTCHGLTPTELPALVNNRVGQEPRECTIQAMRLGVMLLEGLSGVEIGEQAFVRFYLPNASKPLEVPVFVRWCSDGLVGVQMGSLGVRTTIAITSFLQRQAREGLPSEVLAAA